MAAKPRILQGNKDLLWTIVPLVVLSAFVLLVSGNFKLGMGGSAGDDKIPAYDVHADLGRIAQTANFPVRLPAYPATWKPNSGSKSNLGEKIVSNAGFLTAKKKYIQLSQTNATEEQLVSYLAGKGTLGAGIVDIAEHKWVKYEGGEKNPHVWIADFGSVRIALAGDFNDDFTFFAERIAETEPLPRG